MSGESYEPTSLWNCPQPYKNVMSWANTVCASSPIQPNAFNSVSSESPQIQSIISFPPTPGPSSRPPMARHPSSSQSQPPYSLPSTSNMRNKNLLVSLTICLFVCLS